MYQRVKEIRHEFNKSESCDICRARSLLGMAIEWQQLQVGTSYCLSDARTPICLPTPLSSFGLLQMEGNHSFPDLVKWKDTYLCWTSLHMILSITIFKFDCMESNWNKSILQLAFTCSNIIILHCHKFPRKLYSLYLPCLSFPVINFQQLLAKNNIYCQIDFCTWKVWEVTFLYL